MEDIEFEEELFADTHVTPIKGGNIKVDSNMVKYTVVLLLVIAIIWIMHKIYCQVKLAGEDRNQRLTRLYFDNIRGDDFDEEAKNVITYGEAIEEPRAIDHYRVGTVYLLNARNPRNAHRHFDQALRQIINGQVDLHEAPFILDRIEDLHNQFIDVVNVEELPLQQAMLAYYGAQKNQIDAINKQKQTIKSDDPAFKQKTLLSRQEWQADSQNVHDTAIYEELNAQIKKVRSDNEKIKDIHLHNYDEAVNWLRVRYKSDPQKTASINKVIDMLNNDYPVGVIPNVSEKEILTTIWQRTFDPNNTKNASQIREAMGEAVLDCVERDHVVCVTGRSSKMWQALARLDKDEEVGVLKTKQAIRNEIYQKAAKIVDDFVGANGSASQALKTAYSNNENTEQVREMVECIKNKIDDMRTEYKPLMNDGQLISILEECKAVV
jgi:hypothetical protein